MKERNKQFTVYDQFSMLKQDGCCFYDEFFQIIANIYRRQYRCQTVNTRFSLSRTMDQSRRSTDETSLIRVPSATMSKSITSEDPMNMPRFNMSPDQHLQQQHQLL